MGDARTAPTLSPQSARAAPVRTSFQTAGDVTRAADAILSTKLASAITIRLDHMIWGQSVTVSIGISS
jgi:hypothetical protein